MTNVAAVLVIVLATACNGLVVPASAEQACGEQAEDFGPTFTVAGAFDTSLQALRERWGIAWTLNRNCGLGYPMTVRRSSVSWTGLFQKPRLAANNSIER
jgi:hypothetical protein